MSLFDDVLSLAKDAGSIAQEKTQEVLSKSKVNIKIAEIERKIDRAYRDLGKTYVISVKQNESKEEQLIALMVYIDELKLELKELRTEKDNQ